MSDNMNYSILYKSIDYHKNNNDSKNIFEVITECDRISKEIENMKQFLVEENDFDYVGFTRT